MVPKVFSTSIFLNGEKAVAEMQVMMLSPRVEMDGCSVDLVSYARIFARLVRRDDVWKIQYGDCIYERDELIPAAPYNGQVVLPKEVGQYRESYRYLSCILSLQGAAVGTDLPGEDLPGTVEKLYDETNRWMFGEGGPES